MESPPVAQRGRLPSAVAGVALALAATPSPAAHWLARDLGSVFSEETCVAVSESALATYGRLFGGGTVRRSGWVVTLDDVGRRGDDAAITCTFGSGGMTRGTLLIHSVRDDFARRLAADQISGYWRSHAAEADDAHRRSLGLDRFR
ncbi:MAG: hypothetical protein EA355_16200 [Rhodobacteraceae bacterium]|nr:MAG: hypothetical protein EA355_16200 [Paracoccaceae bacterium]